MGIANVALSNTFNEFRTTTNESITQLNAFVDGTGSVLSDALTSNTVTVSTLTSGRVVLAGNSGILQDDSTLTFDTGTNQLSVGGSLDVTGDTQISGNVSIAGNLNVTGNTVTFDVESKVIEDPLIYLASNNYYSDLVDIGFIGNYFNGVNQEHTGIIRHASDGRMYLFTSYEGEPTNNIIDVTNSTFEAASMVAGNAELNYITANGVTSDLIGNVTGNVVATTVTATTFTGDLSGNVTGDVVANTVTTNNFSINNYTFPASDGGANQIFITDGSGNVTFTDLPSGFTTGKAIAMAIVFGG